MPEKPLIFLSYSHEDSEVVEKLADRLRNADFNCWIDSAKLRSDDRYNPEIHAAIERSAVFIAFLSKTYVNKPYCIHEFDYAIDLSRELCIMSACIDDVSRNTNESSKYLFAFKAGHSITGYGSGVKNEDADLDRFAAELIGSLPLQALVSPEARAPITTPQYIRAHLMRYHERQYNRRGNYALQEICPELFTSIRDPETDAIYRDEEHRDVSLLSYIDSSNGSDGKKHILITGEGGIGKTVSLLRTCAKLNDLERNAVYIPLNRLGEDMSLEGYLERHVCGGNPRLWQDLKLIMSEPSDEGSMILLLDGINEMTPGFVGRFIREDIENITALGGVRLIMTSRWVDTVWMNRLHDIAALLEMQPLSDNAVNSYLDRIGIGSITDPTVRAVLRTPLMLTLWANTERHRETYEYYGGIKLEKTPNTRGKILYNFFQTQLFRAEQESGSNHADHLEVLGYLLPAIAYRMVRDSEMSIGDRTLRILLRRLGEAKRNRTGRYDQFDFLSEKQSSDRPSEDIGELFELAHRSLHFLTKSDAESDYSFLHPSFRDYFAACYIAADISEFALMGEICQSEPSPEDELFHDDILSLVSDILHEENARPNFEGEFPHFPGKTDRSPSENSNAEKLLPLWRDSEGVKARNAVANLVRIMQLGRDDNLAWCDLSRLDLRSCRLNGCRFSEWYRGELYSSSFDNALIDRTNFINDGHEADITAIASDGIRIFSGDANGVVRIFDPRSPEKCYSFTPYFDRVVDLAWDKASETLAVLYANVLFFHSTKDRSSSVASSNRSRDKRFRYVNLDGGVKRFGISYDLAPLRFFTGDGKPLSDDLPESASRCARLSPDRKTVVRNNLLKWLSIEVRDDPNGEWKLHPILAAELDLKNRSFDKNRKGIQIYNYRKLNEFKTIADADVTSIAFRDDGTRFIVTLSDTLIELRCDTLECVRSKRFKGRLLGCACYTEDGVALGVENDIILLDRSFSELERIIGAQTDPITGIIGNLEYTEVYICSQSRDIKRLRLSDLTVDRIRPKLTSRRVHWVTDNLTGELQMLIRPYRLPGGIVSPATRYSFETDGSVPLGHSYTMVDQPLRGEDDPHWYILGNKLVSFDTAPPYKRKIFTNYSGIFFYGCSFRGIGGTLAESPDFILRNGGRL